MESYNESTAFEDLVELPTAEQWRNFRPMPEISKLLSVEVRLSLLEARMKLVVLFLEGLIVAFVTALIAYFFKG